jgi:sec-independent protein translocase protein TatB
MSFGELFLVGLIALIILGPERLPKAARTIGLWVGKAKRSFESIKDEIDRELKVKELQQQLEQQKNAFEAELKVENIDHLKDELNDAANTIRGDINNPASITSPDKRSPPTSDKNKA